MAVPPFTQDGNGRELDGAAFNPAVFPGRVRSLATDGGRFGNIASVNGGRTGWGVFQAAPWNGLVADE